nr:capsid protein [Cressdnaviricota sp.]
MAGYKKRPQRKRGLLRKFGGAVKQTLKNRYMHKGGYNIAQIMKDVSLLKTMVNAEKKHYFNVSQGNLLAQCSGATGQGLYNQDITPIPSQGTTSTTRVGNSIKMHSSMMKLQFYQMSACTQPVRVRLVIFKVKGSPQTVSTFVANVFELNQFVLNSGSPAIVDLNSSFNPDFYGTFQIVVDRKYTIKPDQFSGQQSIRSIDIPLKWNHHVRFATDGSQTLSDGQLILVLLADSGNWDASTASTLTNVAVPAVSTGLSFDYSIMNYYYDN